MRIVYLLSLGIFFLYSCESRESQWKQEILDTEADFAAMAAKRGIPEAFDHFAANEAVLMRNNKLIVGKQAMKDFFSSQPPRGHSQLDWKPDFVSVSSSGDLGYTYGKYTYTYTDTLGNKQESKGIFHTVWKKQADGTWKFVWD